MVGVREPQRLLPACLLLAVLSCAALGGAAGALMAIDFGSEHLKASLVKPGRAPISIVLNEMSKRKSPAAVAFVNGDRLLGEEAASVAARYPERVFLQTREMLGKFANDTALREHLTARYLPYEVVADEARGTVRVKTDTGDTYSAEELVAGVLHYARGLARAAAEGLDVVDTVISVPAYYGAAQRRALLDAGELAGLNVLGLINNHAAAALQYGIERDFSGGPETVALVDVGAGSVEVALVEFSTFSVKEGSSVKTYGQFVVKDVEWDEGAGGEQLELVLVEHLAAQFQQKHGVDVRGQPKAMAKLRKQVKRLKEMLSANSEAPLSVEEMYDGIDFRTSIKRTEFEELAGSWFERAAAPLRRLLERNGLKGDELSAVELLGGGSRVPKVKALLSEALGGRQLDTHMDADEALVFGAGLFAANQSNTFRLRKFGMTDSVVYPLTFQLHSGVAEADAPKLLLPSGKRLPAKRVVHLPDSLSDPLEFSLLYELSQGPGRLPPGMPGAELGRFEVTGMDVARTKYNNTESFKLNAHIRADVSGLIDVDKVEAVVEYMVEVATKVPIQKEGGEDADTAAEAGVAQGEAAAGDAAAAGGGAGAEGGAAESEEAAGDKAGEGEGEVDGGNGAEAEEAEGAKRGKKGKKNVVEYETVMVPKKKTGRVACAVGGPGFAVPPLSQEDIKASKKVLAGLAARDAAKREAARAKNDLESYIIETRDKLDGDEEVLQATNEEQRSVFSSALSDMEDWLYMEGDGEPAAEFRKKLRELKKLGDPIFLRVSEVTDRPAAVSRAREWSDLSHKVVNAWEATKPWLKAEDKDALLEQMTKFDEWLNEQEAKQEPKQPHEAPAFTSTEVSAKLNDVVKTFNKLNNKKKPKPPPAPKPPKEDKNAEGDQKEETKQEEAKEEPPKDEL